MNKIGIIGAMEIEVARLKEMMTDVTVTEKASTRLCHFIKNESPRNVVFISISGRFSLK